MSLISLCEESVEFREVVTRVYVCTCVHLYGTKRDTPQKEISKALTVFSKAPKNETDHEGIALLCIAISL